MVYSAVFDKIHHIVHMEVDYVASVYAALRAYCDKLACVTDNTLLSIRYDTIEGFNVLSFCLHCTFVLLFSFSLC